MYKMGLEQPREEEMRETTPSRSWARGLGIPLLFTSLLCGLGHSGESQDPTCAPELAG